MRPRLLIIGASGFVGSRWVLAARQQFDVFSAARTASGDSQSIAVDITQPASVQAAFEQVQPQFVTHLAALSDIDRCEREQNLAEQINYYGALHVARQCAVTGARMLYTSTDAVFDGTKELYFEHDLPSPVNWYGKTKARAEQAIAELLPSAAIVRLSLVLGRSAKPGGNSYIDKVSGNLAAGNPIITPTYEARNPIDVGTLCEFLLELTPNRDATGIFQIGSTDLISRFELATAIANQLGADPALIVPQTAPVPGRAPRGPRDFLVTDRLRQFCKTPVPSSRQVIDRALAATH